MSANCSFLEVLGENMDKLFGVEIKLVVYVEAETAEQAVASWKSVNNYTKAIWHEGDEITAKQIIRACQIPMCDLKDYVYKAGDDEYDKIVGEFLAEQVRQKSDASSMTE